VLAGLALFGIGAAVSIVRARRRRTAGAQRGYWAPIAWIAAGVAANLVLAESAGFVLASAALQISRNRVDKDQLEHGRAHFVAAGLLTVLFLIGQVLAWDQASAGGKLGAGDAAYSLFVLLTGAHGLHLVGGLVVLGRTAGHLFGAVDKVGPMARARIRLSVQLCTTYWHWLLLIWLGLFALLLST